MKNCKIMKDLKANLTFIRPYNPLSLMCLWAHLLILLKAFRHFFDQSVFDVSCLSQCSKDFKVPIFHQVLSSDLSDGLVVTTVGGPTVTVHLINDRVTFTNKAGTTGTVVEANIGATNGVVHALDKVI